MLSHLNVQTKVQSKIHVFFILWIQERRMPPKDKEMTAVGYKGEKVWSEEAVCQRMRRTNFPFVMTWIAVWALAQQASSLNASTDAPGATDNTLESDE